MRAKAWTDVQIRDLVHVGFIPRTIGVDLIGLLLTYYICLLDVQQVWLLFYIRRDLQWQCSKMIHVV